MGRPERFCETNDDAFVITQPAKKSLSRFQKKVVLATKMAELSTLVLKRKKEMKMVLYEKTITANVYSRQFDQTEAALIKTLRPFFKDQIDSAIKKLKSMDSISEGDLNQLFNPDDWNDDLINRTLPVLAKAMAEASIAQYLELKDQIKRKKSWIGRKCGGPGGTMGPCPAGKNELDFNSLSKDVQKKIATTWWDSINPSLREGTWKENDLYSQQVQQADSLFRDHAVEIAKPVETIRGVTGSVYPSKVGEKFTEPGYLRVSTDQSQAEGFTARRGNSGQLLMLTLPKGSRVLPGDHVHEGELYLPRGSSLRVTKVEKVENGRDVFGEYHFIEKIHAELVIDHSEKSTFTRIKASTATEWLESIDDDDPEELQDVVFTTPYGSVRMGILTEYPAWMKSSIEDRLSETFSESYWDDISKTTGGDINEVLRKGLIDGWSIEDMAKEMSERFGGDYPLNRGRLIARTESGNALNGARSAVIDQLISDLGMQDVIKKIWLSVLGNTTRDTHAHLDGVPADKDGCWALGGIRCRWPGDVKLPAEERCNCMCSVFTQFGMNNDTADELIADAEIRQLQAGKSICRRNDFSYYRDLELSFETKWNEFLVKCGGPGGTMGPCPRTRQLSADHLDSLGNWEKSNTIFKKINEGNPRIPSKDAALIKKYTAHNFKGTPVYAKINQELRDGKVSPSNQKIVDALDRSIAANPSKIDAVVYRGISQRAGQAPLPEMKVGQIFSDKSFTSTSSDWTTAADFQRLNKIEHRILQIRIPKGTPALAIGSDLKDGPTEREVILPRNLKYVVTDIKEVDLPNRGKRTLYVVDLIDDLTDEKSTFSRTKTLNCLFLKWDGKSDLMSTSQRIVSEENTQDLPSTEE